MKEFRKSVDKQDQGGLINNASTKIIIGSYKGVVWSINNEGKGSIFIYLKNTYIYFEDVTLNRGDIVTFDIFFNVKNNQNEAINIKPSKFLP